MSPLCTEGYKRSTFLSLIILFSVFLCSLWTKTNSSQNAFDLIGLSPHREPPAPQGGELLTVLNDIDVSGNVTIGNANTTNDTEQVITRFNTTAHRVSDPVENTNSSNSHEAPKIAKLLLWTPFFGDRKWGMKTLGTSAFQEGIDPHQYPYCVTDRCTVTDDRSQLADADVVVFHCRDDIKDKDLLSRGRLPHQIFVVFCLESPTHSSFAAVDAIGMNASATYRLDSDFPVCYGDVAPKWTNSSDVGHYTRQVAWRDKRKSVAWLVSNCRVPSRREILVREMSRYIDVDTLGACGKWRCTQKRDRCYKDFAKQYKFYLSFENSLCRDYVTEKFFLALDAEIVPVVYGGANYTQHAPRHSFINARHFDSPRHLAEFLLELGEDEVRYYEYFEWKKTYRVSSLGKMKLCPLCLAASEGTFQKAARPFQSWWKTHTCRNDYLTEWQKSW